MTTTSSYYQDGVFVDPVVAAMKHLPFIPEHVQQSLSHPVTLGDKLKSHLLADCHEIQQAHVQDRATNPIHTLTRKHFHPNDKDIVFYDEAHVYFIRGSCEGVISVTTFVHAFFPVFDSKAVAQQTVRSKAFKTNSQKKEDHKYFGCNNQDDVLAVWNKARDAGTLLHARIERYMNGMPPTDEDRSSDPCWRQFINLVQNPVLWRFHPYRTEWAIFDPITRIAGTIDFLAHDDQGRFYILDWKRTGAIRDKGFGFGQFGRETGYSVCSDFDSANFWQYSLQLNVYRYILERYYGIKVHRMVLVQMHPELKSDRAQMILVPDLQRTVIRMMATRMNVMKHSTYNLRHRQTPSAPVNSTIYNGHHPAGKKRPVIDL